MSAIGPNLEKIKRELLEYSQSVRLIAVSKYSKCDDIRQAYMLGQRDFGENRVRDLLQKDQELSDCPEIRWHFIGRLQSNKIAKLLSLKRLVAIHSVDRLELLKKIYASKVSQSLEVFLQVNISHEVEKGGLTTIDDVRLALSLSNDNKKVNIVGLMGMGPIRTDEFEKDTIKAFTQLRQMRDELNPKLRLSMGMSQDYRLALNAGATDLRLGSVIFCE